MTAVFDLRMSDLLGGGAGPLVIDAGGQDSASPLLIPNGGWLLQAEFSRLGGDLLLTGDDGGQILVRGYFNHDVPPALMTDSGALIGGDLAARLAGPLAPGQYAQAGDGGTGLQAVGTASKIVGSVQARHADGTSSPLKEGDSIRLGDQLQAGAGASIGITFDDGSVFSLGSGGRMTVDNMVYDAQAARGTESLSVVNGAFSFTSGQIAKGAPDAMTIKTPVATIGVRGTQGAGVAAPEGQRNSVTLLQDPDGTVGQISVSNQAGVQVMSQIGATTQIASAFPPPPPPVILSPQQIQQQYGGALQVLPPPPTPQQLQQQQQQRAAQTTAEKAAADAKVTAAEKAATEKGATEKAAGEKTAAEKAAAEKALGEKLAAEKADMVKLAVQKMGAEGPLAGDGLKANIALQVGDMLSSILGTAVGQFGPQGPFDPAHQMGPLGPLGPLGMGFGPLPPMNFNLEGMINLIGRQVSDIIDTEVQKLAENFGTQAASQSTIVHNLTGGPQTITLTSGANDVMLGTASQGNEVTLSGALGTGDSFIDPTQGDGDTLTLAAAGPNTGWQVSKVEYINLSSATGNNTFLIGSDGSVSISVSSYTETVTSGVLTGFTNDLITGDQTWTILGTLSGSDAFNMGGGTDTLALSSAGTHTVTVNGVESVTLADGTNSLTFATPVTSISVTGGTGTDTLNLAGIGNTVTVSAIESIVGGSGTDIVTLGSGGQSVSITGIESIAGGSGTDSVTLGNSGNTIMISAVETITGGSGTDIVTLGNGGNTVAVSGVESLAGGSGSGTDTLTTTGASLDISSMAVSGIENLVADSDNNDAADTITVTGSQIGAGAISGITASAGSTANNVLRIAASSAAADLSAVTLTNVSIVTTLKTDGATIIGSAGNDVIQGNQGADTLSGGNGNDTLQGGQGADVLSGGAGANVFYYSGTNELGDTVASFTAGTEKFAFVGSQFGSLSAGALSAANFVSGAGATAADADDYFIFNTSNNTLYYDSDGSGANAASAVATIGTLANGAVSVADIQIT